MMSLGQGSVNRTTQIRALRFGVVNRLCVELDPDNSWERLARSIPKRLRSSMWEPRYSIKDIEIFRFSLQRVGGSPTRDLITDWNTQNPTVEHLLDALNRASLIAAVNYILETVLGEEAAQQPVEHRDSSNTSISISEIAPPPLSDYDLWHRTNTQNNESVRDYRSEVHSEGNGPLNQAAPPPRIDESGDSMNGMESVDISTMDLNNADLLHTFNYELLSKITNQFDSRPIREGGKLIGHGGFGQVYYGELCGKKLAIKRLLDDKGVAAQVKTEIEVLAKYKHKNLLPLIGQCTTGHCFCIVYAYMCNGSLEDKLCCKDGCTPLTVAQRVSIAQGTASGINHLHTFDEKALVHRDIKSANVLLDENLVAKVGDFGFARTGYRDSGHTRQVNTTTVIGTTAYMAPESINFDVSIKLDSFSFGVVLLELLTGLASFDNDRSERDLTSYVEENCDDIMEMVDAKAGEWDTHTAHVLYKVAEKCLEGKKKRRATISEILPELNSLTTAVEV